MTTGALIFAFDNNEIDYISMAAWNAKNIKKNLKIGTTVVTDNPSKASQFQFDHVIAVEKELGNFRFFEDIGSTVNWHNQNRVDAYSLTPYDQTLVLDADYVVASDELASLLPLKQDFICHRESFDLASGKILDRLNVFGQHDFPMWWATVMLFRKSNTAQYIFDCMNMVKSNWSHYQRLYGFTKSNYRNDYALSIALGIVSGHTLSVNEIPWPLRTVLPEVKLTYNNQDNIDLYEIEFVDSEKRKKYISFSNADFHAMGKKYLGDIVASNL